MANSGLMAGATCPKPSSPPSMNWNAPSARCARSGLLAVLPRHAGRLRGPAQPVVSGRGHFRRAGRGAHLPEARGLEPHRRPQDKQLPGPDPAGAPHGQAPHHRRDRRGPAWRGHRDGVRAVRPAMRGLHGRAGHGAPVRQCAPHAHAGRAGARRPYRHRDAEGCDERGAARLDRQRRRHLLSAGHRRGPASLSLAGARVPARDRRRDARADPGPDRAPAGCHGRLRRRRFERAGLLLSLPGRRGRADDRRGSGRAGPGQRRSRGQPGAGCPGVLHGCHSYYLQDEDGQIINAHSISAGLDYPAWGRNMRCCTTASAWTMSP